jgi:glycerol-3-phosphate dehydrogenase (NAD(P)+)
MKLNDDRSNELRLAGHVFPQSLLATDSLGEALHGSTAVVFAVPSQTLRENAGRVREHVFGRPLIISAVKGLEQGTHKRMSEILIEELATGFDQRICVLSGPNLAQEVVQGIPTSTVIASAAHEASLEGQNLFNAKGFRVYTNADVIGVELGGAMKNIVAIGAGICDGLGFGNNTKAAFITRGLSEITRLAVAAGGALQTFSGLAGMGDLLATCYSSLSRNRLVGEGLALGRQLDAVTSDLGGQVAEGVATIPGAIGLAKKLGVEIPIIETTGQILFGGLPPEKAVQQLMGRPPGPE